MIKKRTNTAGIQTNVSLEPTSAAQSNNNINNNIIINKRDDGKEDIVITRDLTIDDKPQDETLTDYKLTILETFAQILLNQDKALLANLISKNTIIVPATSLQQIIKSITKAESVDIFYDEDIHCCATKSNPIRKIESIKIVNENGEVCTDFKQTYNKEFNDLTNNYHVCLKYVING